MPFKSKEDANAYHRKYYHDHPRMRELAKIRFQIKQQRWKDWLVTQHCSLCNSQDHLHLHHLTPDEKIDSCSRITFDSLQFQQEKAKCIVLCRSCHSKLHYQLRQHDPKSI